MIISDFLICHQVAISPTLGDKIGQCSHTRLPGQF